MENQKKELENIFGAGRVTNYDGNLNVSLVYRLDFENTSKLNAFCVKYGLDYMVKPASDCLYIEVFKK